MFDIGWTEMLVVAVVAIIVIGPKDLPGMLRTLGQYFGKIKRAANEFRSQFDEVLRETEMADLRDDLKNEARELRDSTIGQVEDDIKDMEADLDQEHAEEFDADWPEDDAWEEDSELDPPETKEAGEADLESDAVSNGKSGVKSDSTAESDEFSGRAVAVAGENGAVAVGGSGAKDKTKALKAKKKGTGQKGSKKAKSSKKTGGSKKARTTAESRGA